jgi:hypothetical protein
LLFFCPYGSHSCIFSIGKDTDIFLPALNLGRPRPAAPNGIISNLLAIMIFEDKKSATVIGSGFL